MVRFIYNFPFANNDEKVNFIFECFILLVILTFPFNLGHVFVYLM